MDGVEWDGWPGRRPGRCGQTHCSTVPTCFPRHLQALWVCNCLPGCFCRRRGESRQLSRHPQAPPHNNWPAALSRCVERPQQWPPYAPVLTRPALDRADASVCPRTPNTAATVKPGCRSFTLSFPLSRGPLGWVSFHESVTGGSAEALKQEQPSPVQPRAHLPPHFLFSPPWELSRLRVASRSGVHA